MTASIVYVDASEVRDGKLEELRTAVGELVAFVEANLPREIAYNVYLDPDGRRMSVVHIHPDTASLEEHMEVAGAAFRGFTELVTLSAIDVFGSPNERLMQRLRDKAELLGNGTVRVHPHLAGFDRLAKD